MSEDMEMMRMDGWTGRLTRGALGLLLGTTCLGLGALGCQGQTMIDGGGGGGGGGNSGGDNNGGGNNGGGDNHGGGGGNHGGGEQIDREDLPEFSPPAPVMRRLTRAEYENTVRDLFGLGVQIPGELEPDTPINGLSAVGASQLALSRRGVEQYEAAGLEIARQAMSSDRVRGQIVPCEPASQPVDSACARQFVEQFGKRVWRRPLTVEELARYTDVADFAAGELNDFGAGLEHALAGMLQSPYFLYRVEYGQPDPEDPTRRRLTDHELAARMSYLIWNTTPDAELLAAADTGQLSTPEGLRAQAERLLASPKTRGALRSFWIEYWHIDNLSQLNKDAQTYPEASPRLMSSMREETLRLLDHIVFTEGGDFRRVFDTRTTFVDNNLADLYGLQLDRQPVPGEFVRAEHPTSSPRRGVLGHASILAANAHPVATSPTHRGKFVRESLLCRKVPPPPNDVNTDLPEPDPSAGPQTLRMRLESYSETPQCGGCHRLMDPIGFAFESFDALGRHRTMDNGLPVQTNGELDGQQYEDLTGLAAVLKAHPEATECLVKKTYRYATGRVEDEDGEARVIYDLHEAFASAGYDYKSLLTEIVTSEGFRYNAVPSQQPPSEE